MPPKWAYIDPTATSAASESNVRWAAFFVVIAGGAFAQLFATDIPGNQVFHTGLAFTVAAALLLPPELVVVVCVAQHVPEWLRQRYPWFIQSFNIANVVLSGLAAWSVRAALTRDGVHVGASAATTGVLVACVAALTCMLVNHALLARMLALPLRHQLSRNLDGLRMSHRLAGLQAFDFDTGLAIAEHHDYAAVLRPWYLMYGH